MQRYDYLKLIAADAKDALCVSTGWGSREWWAVRPSDGNLKTPHFGIGLIDRRRTGDRATRAAK
jgi:hypothetical protein